MNEPSLTHTDGGDAFQVMFSAGELRVLSLDELDEAFNAGKVDERTFVLAPGTSEWARLGDLLGIEAAPAGPEAPEEVISYVPQRAAPQAAPEEVISYIPQRAAPQAAPEEVISYIPQRAAPQAAPEEVISYIPQRAAPQAAPEEVISYIPQRAAPQAAPLPTVMVAAPPPAVLDGGAFSTRPVALDLDDDIGEQHLRPKRRAPVVVALAMVALGVGGFFAYRAASTPSEAAMTAAAAAAAIPVAAPVTTPTITPTVAVAAPIDDNHRVVLTDDQRKALAAADKAHATKAASQHAARAATATHSSGKHSKEKVFHNGGNAYDPLNGSL